MGVSNGEYANKKRQRSYDNAKLEVVHRDLIPSILKTNVGVESVEKHLLVASFYMAHADPHYFETIKSLVPATSLWYGQLRY
ncbi:GL13131 [Drosophila persimilis]|uniref:GL13131 n=1 Tax=Drosophila persimilis TaxID=7234 RepID=B4IS85_DROPE|nr:GL13131 [Drosophila persimilis]